MEWQEAGLLNKSSSLTATLVVTKFVAVIGNNWVTLSSPAQVQLRCSTTPPMESNKVAFLIQGSLVKGEGSVRLTSLY